MKMILGGHPRGDRRAPAPRPGRRAARARRRARRLGRAPIQPSCPPACEPASPTRERHASRGREDQAELPASERARQAEGRLPSGRHDLPRQFIVKNQRERIVDATAAIVAEKGLAGADHPRDRQARERLPPDLLRDVPHQARRLPRRAEGRPAPGAARSPWRRTRRRARIGRWAVAAGMQRAARLPRLRARARAPDVVDTFAASPLAIEIRDTGAARVRRLPAARATTTRRRARVPDIAPEAIAGGIWQVLHHYIEHERVEDIAELRRSSCTSRWRPSSAARRPGESLANARSCPRPA